jgi:ATP-binding cassette subfamily B protein
MAASLGLFKAILSKARQRLPYLYRGLGLVWNVARPWTIAWLILLTLQGLLPAATVYLTKLLVDSVVTAISGNPARVLPLVLLLGAIMLLIEIVRAAINWVRAVQAELVQDHVASLIQEKSVAVDLAFYELPDYYDHLHRARVESNSRPVALLENFGSLLQNSITLIAMGAILIPLGPWLSLVLLLSTLPALYVVLRYALVQYEWRLRTTPLERKAWYYDWLVTGADSAAEIRLFDLGQFFQRTYQLFRNKLRTERLRLVFRQNLAELLASTFALSIAGVALGWMAWQASRGLVTLGELALIYVAFNQGQRLIRTLLESVGQLYANGLFLTNLFEFLDLKPAVQSVGNTKLELAACEVGIEFQNVSFRYPSSPIKTLDDFNLKIPAGKIAAIVGPNGAGKSTLIKLLCRFYDPDHGRIMIDGKDLKDLPLSNLRGQLTVLFQQPFHYNATVRENVAYGDLQHQPTDREIDDAIEAAGAAGTLARLPEGRETFLGKSFGMGTELSVGEWQRIALARAFLRQAPILLLDEPTSALDPWAESNWLIRFRRLAQQRTAVIITHRLTTAMHADVIYVVQEGRVVESGAHEDLLALDGLYAESWERQIVKQETR